MFKHPYNKLVPAPFDGPAVLNFSLVNAKLEGTGTAAFSLPAGYTCPGACDCLAWFDRTKGKLVDGPKAKFRCFAASMEASFSSVRASVEKNYSLLLRAKTIDGMATMIDMSLPARAYHNIRVHADGDFFNANYFLAWMKVAELNPGRTFYAYTKNLPVWVKNRSAVPANFVLTASRGGKFDDMIEQHGLRSATVVMHPDEASALGLKIDHDDSLARSADHGDFALLIHGQQPAGSEASVALKRLRTEGVKYSYGRKGSKSKTSVTAARA